MQTWEVIIMLGHSANWAANLVITAYWLVITACEEFITA